MNDADNTQPIDDPAEKLPKYCDFFKHLLVEEVALEADYRQIHYGKCAVIGRLCAVPDHFTLENVTIPHLPSDYKLPTGVVSILLLNFSSAIAGAQSLSHNSYCILRGEVVLCNLEVPNSPTLSIRGLHEQLLQFSEDDIKRSQILEKVHKTHKPALYVWYANAIEQAEELVQRRLEIRMLSTDRKKLDQ